MEQTSNSSLFSLSIDPVTKAHLFETAKWARFLSILGMILIVLSLLGVLFFTYTMSSMSGTTTNDFEGSFGPSIFSSFGVGIAVLYIIIFVIWFFPLLFLLRFANKMKASLVANDQKALNDSFQNLKACFRFIGIITIIILVIYALALVFGVLGAAAFS